MPTSSTTLLSLGRAISAWSFARPTHDLKYADDALLLSLTTLPLQDILSAAGSAPPPAPEALWTPNRGSLHLEQPYRQSLPRLCIMSGEGLVLRLPFAVSFLLVSQGLPQVPALFRVFFCGFQARGSDFKLGREEPDKCARHHAGVKLETSCLRGRKARLSR